MTLNLFYDIKIITQAIQLHVLKVWKSNWMEQSQGEETLQFTNDSVSIQLEATSGRPALLQQAQDPPSAQQCSEGKE